MAQYVMDPPGASIRGTPRDMVQDDDHRPGRWTMVLGDTRNIEIDSPRSRYPMS
jgi:hypothetical protein